MEQQYSEPTGTNVKQVFKTILIAGFIVGTLDGLAAITSSYIQREVTPDRVFQFVASGVFGKDAFAGGIPMALLGVIFHYIVAYGWTTLFFLAYPKLKFLSWNKYIVGIAYGIFVLFAMQLVVVPLSNVPNAKPGVRLPQLPQVFIHMFLVGLPIVLLAKRYYLREKQAS
jgi:hypothetical protein